MKISRIKIKINGIRVECVLFFFFFKSIVGTHFLSRSLEGQLLVLSPFSPTERQLIGLWKQVREAFRAASVAYLTQEDKSTSPTEQWQRGQME